VSIAADNSGILRGIFSVSLDEISASLGRKSLYRGRSKTSSNVNALCFNFSMTDYNQTNLEKKGYDYRKTSLYF